jgi:hypothetical protein
MLAQLYVNLLLTGAVTKGRNTLMLDQEPLLLYLYMDHASAMSPHHPDGPQGF